MNNTTTLEFAFEEIANNKNQKWYEMLLRPYSAGKRISTEGFLNNLNEEELLEIDLYVFRSISKIQKENQFDRISVNLSPSSLASPIFRKAIQHLVLSDQIQASKLCVEITEQALTKTSPEIIRFLNILRANKALIAIDDFGTGSAHWKLIQNEVVDVIKIACQKLGSMQTNKKQDYIKALLDFSNALNLTTIIEGIEQPKDLKVAKKMGFEYFQGWLFSHPPENNIERALA